ncbi:hypothetical protein GNI_123770 [Gregarina niphandrodes]|uniref:Transmembrane protein n=1 Tax=Gregarina niphandrodes TaxID=110365 RepID=A0A023B2C1_GRENI|nr:hypothetical protein GNI_123770 [Gregarina niphandrodes]EZG51720.1 hypothetical protein GNI_123770 [Gregarina niphandrodes]|eukprot:XP_011131933.1 hypothetical protein GNI_123770 [Gregarina niphandrodes]
MRFAAVFATAFAAPVSIANIASAMADGPYDQVNVPTIVHVPTARYAPQNVNLYVPPQELAQDVGKKGVQVPRMPTKKAIPAPQLPTKKAIPAPQPPTKKAIPAPQPPTKKAIPAPQPPTKKAIPAPQPPTKKAIPAPQPPAKKQPVVLQPAVQKKHRRPTKTQNIRHRKRVTVSISKSD